MEFDLSSFHRPNVLVFNIYLQKLEPVLKLKLY